MSSIIIELRDRLAVDKVLADMHEPQLIVIDKKQAWIDIEDYHGGKTGTYRYYNKVVMDLVYDNEHFGYLHLRYSEFPYLPSRKSAQYNIEFVRPVYDWERKQTLSMWTTEKRWLSGRERIAAVDELLSWIDSILERCMNSTVVEGSIVVPKPRYNYDNY